jgi:competence protein ComEC
MWGFIATCLAISLGYYRIPLWGILFFCCMISCSPLLISDIKKRNMIVVLILFMLGIIVGKATFPLEDPLKDFYGENIIVIGTVSDEPKLKDYGVVYTLKTKELNNNSIVLKKRFGLKVTQNLVDDKKNKLLKIGDVIVLTGNLSEPLSQHNPGGFNYQLYLKSKGIDGLLYEKSGNVEIISHERFGFYELIMLRIKLEKISKTYLSPNSSDLLLGIVFGDKGINSELKSDFQEAGVAHLLSVSGLHVGYVFLGLSFLLTQFKIKKKHWIIFLIPCLFFYCALTNFASSVIRASLMLSTLMIGQGFHKEQDLLNNLVLAGIIILLIWPSQLFQAGFQLSFCAVLGIVLFYKPILYVYEKRCLKGKKPGLIAQGIGVTFCAMLGTSPVMLYHFNGFTLLSFLSNMIVVPVVGLFLLMGILFLVLTLIFPFLGSILGLLVSFLSDTLLVLIFGLNTIGEVFQFLKIKRGRLSVIGIIIYLYLSFLLTGYFQIKIPWVKKTTVISGLVLGTILVVISLLPGYLEVTVLDVGQGDSIIIETPNGNNYLIDGGGYRTEKSTKISDDILLPALYANNISKLSGAFITHNHVDHSQGIEELVDEKFPIDTLFMSINTNNEKLLNEKNVCLLKKGSLIQGSDGVTLEVLSPDGNLQALDDDHQNNGSLVILLSYKAINFLFCGDIEKEVEEKLVSDIKEKDPDRDIQMIKIPHHGSKTSSTEAFIKAVDPELAVISVGRYNTFGHPNLEVINRLNNEKIQILRTDKNGAVELVTNGEWVRYKTYKNEQGEENEL